MGIWLLHTHHLCFLHCFLKEFCWCCIYSEKFIILWNPYIYSNESFFCWLVIVDWDLMLLLQVGETQYITVSAVLVNASGTFLTMSLYCLNTSLSLNTLQRLVLQSHIIINAIIVMIVGIFELYCPEWVLFCCWLRWNILLYWSFGPNRPLPLFVTWPLITKNPKFPQCPT